MCNISEVICNERMKKVESMAEDLSKLSDEVAELKTEVAISITYQKEQTKALNELKEELKESKKRKVHPLENVFYVVLGGVLLFLIQRLIELI